jgi:hypothetical protein
MKEIKLNEQELSFLIADLKGAMEQGEWGNTSKKIAQQIINKLEE